MFKIYKSGMERICLFGQNKNCGYPKRQLQSVILLILLLK